MQVKYIESITRKAVRREDNRSRRKWEWAGRCYIPDREKKYLEKYSTDCGKSVRQYCNDLILGYGCCYTFDTEKG